MSQWCFFLILVKLNINLPIFLVPLEIGHVVFVFLSRKSVCVHRPKLSIWACPLHDPLLLDIGVAVHRGVMMADTLSFNAKIGVVEYNLTIRDSPKWTLESGPCSRERRGSGPEKQDPKHNPCIPVGWI